MSTRTRRAQPNTDVAPDGEVPTPMSTSEAAVYQRLRAHLAFLRLGAAGEALTSILDNARSQDLSLIAAMEQLLAIESKPPKFGGSPAGYGLPAYPSHGRWPTTTSPPNPAWTPNSSPSWPPCVSLKMPATCCSSARPAPARHARCDPGSHRRRRRTPGLLHHCRRPHPPRPQSPTGRPVRHLHALLLRTTTTRHRRVSAIM